MHVGSQLPKIIAGANTVIVDCITLLINNILLKYSGHTGEVLDALRLEKEVMTEINELIDCMNLIQASFIIVTNEVGLGLVPANEMGRLYRDLLGKANQILAQHADEVYLMVAGMPIKIKSSEGSPTWEQR